MTVVITRIRNEFQKIKWKQQSFSYLQSPHSVSGITVKISFGISENVSVYVKRISSQDIGLLDTNQN